MRLTWILLCPVLLLQVFESAAVAAANDLKRLETELQQVRKLESTGNVAAAIKRYEALIERYPQEPGLYNNLAVLMAKTGKLDAAREQLEQAMHLDQVYATVYENLSAVYVEMARGSYARALQVGVTPQQVSLKEVELNTQPLQKADAQENKQNMTTALAVTPKESSLAPEQPPELDNDILQTLKGWASAWSAQEVELYLSFYAPDFRPAKGMSRGRWEQQRSVRLRRPAWVKVSLNSFQVQPAEGGLARVRFLQHYQSNTYRDKTWKEVLLKSSPEGWRILSERSL